MSDKGLEAFLRKVIHAEDADSALSMIAEATEDQGRFMYEGYLRSAFRDLWNEREAATEQTQAERSEAPNPETSVPPVDPEVLDAAIKAAADATQEPWWEMQGREEAEVAFRAAAPVIAAAAYRQGREDLEARIEELAAEWEEAKPRFEGDAQANQLIYEFIRDLRSLLTDKEGETNG